MPVTRDTLRQLRDLRVDVGQQIDAAVGALTKAWNGTWRDLRPRWRAASTAVFSAAVALRHWPQPWELARLPELRTALNATDAGLVDLGRRVDKTVGEAAAAAVTATVAAEALILASQWPADQRAAVAARFAANLPPRIADLVSARSAAQVTNAVRPLAADTMANVERLVVRGVPLNGGATATAQQLAATVRVGFDGGLIRAANVARTETMDAQRAGSHAFRLANLEAATGWVWCSVLSPSTCVACWVMHGTVYEGAAEVGPLGHVGCRCVALTLRGDVGLLPDARSRFNRLPDADQIRILGQGRHALLHSGAVAWGDLAARRPSWDWRPSYTPRSLADLQRIARIRI